MPEDEKPINERATGARIFQAEPGVGDSDDTRPAENRPKRPYGLTQPVDETEEETHSSEGVQPPGAPRGTA